MHYNIYGCPIKLTLMSSWKCYEIYSNQNAHTTQYKHSWKLKWVLINWLNSCSRKCDKNLIWTKSAKRLCKHLEANWLLPQWVWSFCVCHTSSHRIHSWLLCVREGWWTVTVECKGRPVYFFDMTNVLKIIRNNYQYFIIYFYSLEFCVWP